MKNYTVMEWANIWLKATIGWCVAVVVCVVVTFPVLAIALAVAQ